MKQNKFALRIKIEFMAIKVAGYLVFMGGLFTYAFFINKVWQAILILGSYTLLRWCFPTTWHHKQALPCLCYAFIIFCVLDTLSLPLSISILSSVVLSLVLTHILYKVQESLDTIEEQRLKLAELADEVEELMSKIKHKNIYSMNEKELYEHCKSCGLDDIECKIAYCVIILHMKGKDLYSAVNYSERQLKRKRQKIMDAIQ